MGDGFAKIYGDRLLRSTLFLEPPEARLVFLAMLAMANADGVVDVPGLRALANVLNLEVSYVERALAILEAPDPDSRSKDHEGRRVLRLETGWQLVNYIKYREHRTAKQEKTRLRVAKHRSVTRTNVRAEAEEEAKGEAAEEPSAPAGAPAAADACRVFGEMSGHTYPMLTHRDAFGNIASQARDYPDPAVALRKATEHFWRPGGWAQTAKMAKPSHLATNFHRELAEANGETVDQTRAGPTKHDKPPAAYHRKFPS